MEKTQKEYYLNEQMRAIQKELGEKDEVKNEIEELKDALRQKKMPAEAREKCEREIKKLKMMSPMSPEATVLRNYLDWFLALPWFEYTEDKLDIKEAERILEEDHYGLRRSSSASSNTSPCKPWLASSRGRSCAWLDLRASARPRLASRWHEQRTQVAGFRSAGCATRPKFAAIAGPTSRAARQGDPVHAQGRVGQSRDAVRRGRTTPPISRRPVFGHARGPRPEQNCTFNDHHLDRDYDLSKVMFITTANTSRADPRSCRTGWRSSVSPATPKPRSSDR